MKSTSDLFQNRIFEKEKTPSSERAFLVKKILDTINHEREGTPYKPLTPIAIAVKLKGIKTGDLVGFVKECENATCGFSRCFFGRLKRK